MKRRSPLSVAVAGAAVVLLGGCGGSTDAAAGDEPTVQAAFYPLQFVAERVAGEHATVEGLTKPGAEPHGFELTPRQVGDVAEADLVVYLEGFQPAVDQAVEQNAPERALDVISVLTTGEGGAGANEHADDHADTDEHADEHADEHGAGDPHVWLDPTKLATITEAVADRLAEVDPAGAADYERNAAALVDELEQLDAEFQAGLADCERRTFVTSHAAFGHLAERYDLEQVAVSGLSPEAEPSPARIREVQETVREKGITTIFYETLVSPKVATTMAADLGVDTAVLDPVEGITDDSAGQDYLAVMRANLEALRAANGCA